MIADLHIHSHHSLATSRDATLPGLHRWAQLKGVGIVGTGDATHPGWRQELRELLRECAPGLYRLRREAAGPEGEVPGRCRAPVRFLVTAEVSTVYSQGGRARRIHSLLLFPHLEAAEAFSRALEPVARLASDGRPTLRMSARE
ncbi:MAG: DNA helicase UvrD, partial [Lentisphaeria bacterium]|nr:DNA helicase UvrD [Lentisphaeria bacterium]